MPTKREIARLPEADRRLARRRRGELRAERDTIAEIDRSITAFIRATEKWRDASVSLANDGRRIGILILEWWDKLPGKQMTIDFWQQYESRFVDQCGHRVTLDMLKMFVRIAQNNPQPFTSVQTAMSYRQLLFGAAGFELEGGRLLQHAHEPPNFYNELIDKIFDPKPVTKCLEALANDPNFGPVEHWPAERKTRVLLQLKPFDERYEEFKQKLQAGV